MKGWVGGVNNKDGGGEGVGGVGWVRRVRRDSRPESSVQGGGGRAGCVTRMCACTGKAAICAFDAGRNHHWPLLHTPTLLNHRPTLWHLTAAPSAAAPTHIHHTPPTHAHTIATRMPHTQHTTFAVLPNTTVPPISHTHIHAHTRTAHAPGRGCGSTRRRWPPSHAQRHQTWGPPAPRGGGCHYCST